MRNPFKIKRYEYWTEIIQPGHGLNRTPQPFGDQRWQLIHLSLKEDWHQSIAQSPDFNPPPEQQGAWLVAVWEREL